MNKFDKIFIFGFFAIIFSATQFIVFSSNIAFAGSLLAEENLFLEIIGGLIQKITEPITTTIFNTPWHIAFLILFIYVAPPVLLLYFLIKQSIKK